MVIYKRKSRWSNHEGLLLSGSLGRFVDSAKLYMALSNLLELDLEILVKKLLDLECNVNLTTLFSLIILREECFLAQFVLMTLSLLVMASLRLLS